MSTWRMCRWGDGIFESSPSAMAHMQISNNILNDSSGALVGV